MVRDQGPPLGICFSWARMLPLVCWEEVRCLVLFLCRDLPEGTGLDCTHKQGMDETGHENGLGWERSREWWDTNKHNTCNYYYNKHNPTFFSGVGS